MAQPQGNSFIFIIVGKKDNPIYEAEFSAKVRSPRTPSPTAHTPPDTVCRDTRGRGARLTAHDAGVEGGEQAP